MSRTFLTAPLRRPSARYPLPDFEPYLKQIIIQALRSAWERIIEQVSHDGGDLLEEAEPALNARLENALNAIQAEPGHPSGFSGSIFQSVVRGAEMVSFNSARLEKRPDLTFRLISTTPGCDRHLHSLFVECKIVGPSHSVEAYCLRGLARFVCGDYAWAMPSAMMLAYAHPGFSVATALIPFLRNAISSKETLWLRSPPRLTRLVDPPVYQSGHARPWTYPDGGDAPGDIAVLHLWLPFAAQGGNKEEDRALGPYT
jgi:hypothetical protein